ncbi:hypothetical protein C8R46DRAFT_1265959 [Mycena filopes]|nr:hypothetical protein C8R46DRAFT_1265959 [Mycena filopes]
MSREDRRPLLQVPEDSVNTYMPPSYPPQAFTLQPPYNPIDAIPYFLSDPLPPDWAFFQPTNVQDFIVTDTEHPYHAPNSFVPVFPDMQPPMLDQELSPIPQFDLSLAPDQPLLHDAAQFVPFMPDPNQLLSHNLDQLAAAYDLNAMLNQPIHFPDFFAQPEYYHVPTAIEASEMVQSSVGSVPSPAPRARRTRSKTAPAFARVRPSGFAPSDPDEISSHEKKRLYVSCLEQYICYLHGLFASINVTPVPLERAPTARGLSSRSLRTILLCLGRSADLVHTMTKQAEEKFHDLTMREALLDAQSLDCAELVTATAASPSSDSTASSTTCVASDADLLDEIAKLIDFFRARLADRCPDLLSI